MNKFPEVPLTPYVSGTNSSRTAHFSLGVANTHHFPHSSFERSVSSDIDPSDNEQAKISINQEPMAESSCSLTNDFFNFPDVDVLRFSTPFIEDCQHTASFKVPERALTIPDNFPCVRVRDIIQDSLTLESTNSSETNRTSSSEHIVCTITPSIEDRRASLNLSTTTLNDENENSVSTSGNASFDVTGSTETTLNENEGQCAISSTPHNQKLPIPNKT